MQLSKLSIHIKRDGCAGDCPFHAGMKFINDRGASHPVMGDSVAES